MSASNRPEAVCDQPLQLYHPRSELTLFVGYMTGLPRMPKTKRKGRAENSAYWKKDGIVTARTFDKSHCGFPALTGWNKPYLSLVSYLSRRGQMEIPLLTLLRACISSMAFFWRRIDILQYPATLISLFFWFLGFQRLSCNRNKEVPALGFYQINSRS